jgi:TetR/AcrR family transcriptional regulator of autoinduction and epiphytic fitness
MGQHGQGDGRRRRSVRTRQALIDAYLDLVREKHGRPATTELAARAGCSTRSVFERFQSIHALELAALDHLTQQLAAIPQELQLDADRQARIGAYARMRALKCETWLAHWRVLRGTETASVDRQSRLEAVRRLNHEFISAIYGAELSAVDEVTRRNIVIALQGLTEFESWGLMRDTYGLSVEDACKVWTEAIDRLLPCRVSLGDDSVSRGSPRLRRGRQGPLPGDDQVRGRDDDRTPLRGSPFVEAMAFFAALCFRPARPFEPLPF